MILYVIVQRYEEGGGGFCRVYIDRRAPHIAAEKYERVVPRKPQTILLYIVPCPTPNTHLALYLACIMYKSKITTRESAHVMNKMCRVKSPSTANYSMKTNTNSQTLSLQSTQTNKKQSKENYTREWVATTIGGRKTCAPNAAQT